MKRLLIILLSLSCALAAFAQGEVLYESKDNIPLLGRIVTSDSLFPVRNTHVISKMAHRGTISNRDGEFFIQARKQDTLWISCIGFARQLIPIDSSMKNLDSLVIKLEHDTIVLKEMTFKPFYDYNTFKQMVIEMPTIETPREIRLVNEELAQMRTGQKRNPYLNVDGNGITASPLQFIYDKYNKSARRQAKILRNRRMFNEILKEQGRTDELLPDSLDYYIDYRIYEFQENEKKNDSLP